VGFEVIEKERVGDLHTHKRGSSIQRTRGEGERGVGVKLADRGGSEPEREVASEKMRMVVGDGFGRLVKRGKHQRRV